MAVFKCKMCGGQLDITENMSTVTCEYCGSQQTLPMLNDDKIERLYDRANHFRRNNEFDKAMGIYEQILEENANDSEIYWSLVLCRYGIEYVEDPTTHRRVPTVNRTQLTSVFDDENYKKALEFADDSQKVIYEEEAKQINEIQKGILAISQNEEPFDVFICYKETDENGERTRDSVQANELYHELTKEGFKVFYARITLEDKLGQAYEPYIFAALNSAKVMVVIGSKPEYFNAVWVKNEWSRYLGMMKKGEKKTLIPAYCGMDPYDLPGEFSHLQAQDMMKLGFMPDLIRGIKKIIGVDKIAPTPAVQMSSGVLSGGTNSLLKRIEIFIDNRDWDSANTYCEKVLDVDPENSKAYLYKLFVEARVETVDELVNCGKILEDFSAYRNVIKYVEPEVVVHIEKYNEKLKEELRIEQERQVYLEYLNLEREKVYKAISVKEVQNQELYERIHGRDIVVQRRENKKKLAIAISYLVTGFIALILIVGARTDGMPIMESLLVLAAPVLLCPYLFANIYKKPTWLAIGINLLTFGVMYTGISIWIIVMYPKRMQRINESDNPMIESYNNNIQEMHKLREYFDELNEKIEKGSCIDRN